MAKDKERRKRQARQSFITSDPADEARAFETCTIRFRKMADNGQSEHCLHEGERKNVTPAEFRIIQMLHGKDNVTVVETTGHAVERDPQEDKTRYDDKLERDVVTALAFRFRTHDEEVARLRNHYGMKLFGSADLYPGVDPSLPLTFKEAKIHTSIPDNVEHIAPKASVNDQKQALVDALNRNKNAGGGTTAK